MVRCRLAPGEGAQTRGSVDRGVRRRGNVELEQPEVARDHRHRHVVDRHLPDRARERARLGVAVEDEVGLVLRDRRREPVRPQVTPDPGRLSLDRLFRRGIVQQHDARRAHRDVTQPLVQGLHVERCLLVDGTEQRLAEIGQVRARESTHEALEADNPDVEAAGLAHVPAAVEDVDAAALEHRHQLLGAVDVPVVVAEHRVHRDVEGRAGIGQHSALLGLPVGGQIAGQQHEVGDAVQRCHRATDLVAVSLGAVDVPGGGDPQAVRAGAVLHIGVQLPTCGYFHRTVRHRDAFNALIDTMKITVAALREADVEFMLGGSMAAWARGGPEPDNDLDLMVKPDHADAALEALAGAGMRVERPPEEWLYKAWHCEVLIDLIFCPSGLELTDEVFARGETIAVMAVGTPVMALEDVLTTMLYALDEHTLDYSRLLAITRALREQIDWTTLRVRVTGSPYAKAFMTLVDELEIAPASAQSQRPPLAAGEAHARVRVVGGPD